MPLHPLSPVLARRRPRTFVLTLAAVASTFALVLGGAAIAPGARAQTIESTGSTSVAVRNRVVDAGGRTMLSASILRAGRPLAGQRAVLQQRVAGTSRWRVLRTVLTDSNGRVSAATGHLLHSKEFRLRYRTSGSVVNSNVVNVVVPTWVAVASTSPLTPTAGAPITLSGTTSPQLAGARVHLQTVIDGAWKSVSSSVVGADSTYTVRAIATRGGDQPFRAVVRAAAGRAEAVSPVIDYTVYAWYRLAELAGQHTEDTSAFITGRAVVGGDVEEQSLFTSLTEGSTARLSFALGERCTTFRGRIGAGSGGQFEARWRLIADDEAPIDQVLSQGGSSDAAVEITGASRLTLVNHARSGSGTVAWGNPEVLCAGRP